MGSWCWGGEERVGGDVGEVCWDGGGGDDPVFITSSSNKELSSEQQQQRVDTGAGKRGTEVGRWKLLSISRERQRVFERDFQNQPKKSLCDPLSYIYNMLNIIYHSMFGDISK